MNMLNCYLWNGPNLYYINFESLTLTLPRKYWHDISSVEER